MQVNDIVIFSPRAGETAEGIVTRVWDKPAGNVYVTIRADVPGTDVPRTGTFVRCSSEVTKPRVPAVGHSHEWDYEHGADPAPYMCQACNLEHGDPYAFTRGA